MLGRPDRVALHRGPVDARVQRLVHQAHQAHVLPAHNVQAERHLGRRLAVVGGADHALDGVFEDLGSGVLALGFVCVWGGGGDVSEGGCWIGLGGRWEGDAYEVGGVVVRCKGADEVAAVGGDDAHFLCG